MYDTSSYMTDSDAECLKDLVDLPGAREARTAAGKQRNVARTEQDRRVKHEDGVDAEKAGEREQCSQGGVGVSEGEGG